MNSNTFYDTKMVPFAERESFNNTILLLTMVKSEYYYIIGFSRPQGRIRVGFDFKSDFCGCVSEIVEVDFGSSQSSVEMKCVLCNIDVSEFCAQDFLVEIGKFEKTEEGVIYKCEIPKDKVLPTGIRDMNEYLLQVREEIGRVIRHYHMCQ